MTDIATTLHGIIMTALVSVCIAVVILYWVCIITIILSIAIVCIGAVVLGFILTAGVISLHNSTCE